MKGPSLSSKGLGRGSYLIKVHDSNTGQLLKTIGPIKNRIVNSSGYGYDIIAKLLGGEAGYSLEIASASIGTGAVEPTDSTTDLTTPVLTGIDVADVEYPDIGKVLLSFFIANSQLAEGTYREFCIKTSTGAMFAMSLISPVFIKGPNQNVTFEYTIDFS